MYIDTSKFSEWYMNTLLTDSECAQIISKATGKSITHKHILSTYSNERVIVVLVPNKVYHTLYNYSVNNEVYVIKGDTKELIPTYSTSYLTAHYALDYVEYILTQREE